MRNRVYVIVEGQSEEEFVNQMPACYLSKFKIYATPIIIRTSKNGRGGFVNYQHLRNDADRLLKSTKDDFLVTMFVDFFRCPELPQRELYEKIEDHSQRADKMQECIGEDIRDRRFIPYIQLHEFEALLYSSNKGFLSYFSEDQAKKTQQIVDSFPNPELINSSPQKSPSKRLLEINSRYDKVTEGNLIALEVGFETILEKCPRFRFWIERIIKGCSEG
ncbi:MAG: DUF4276 family protein [Paludibacteraceae bacterium]